MATSGDDNDMAREALDLADSWGDVDLDAGQIVELANALQDAWRLGRTSANEHRDVQDAALRGPDYASTVEGLALDAHSECAEELRAVGCAGETTVDVMTHAVERIKRADAAEAEGNRVIEALAKRADSEAEDAREAIATLQNEINAAGEEAEAVDREGREDLGSARRTIKSLRATLSSSSDRCRNLEGQLETQAKAKAKAKAARDAATILQGELRAAEHTIRSLSDELRETNVLRRDSHSRLQAVRDAVRED